MSCTPGNIVSVRLVGRRGSGADDSRGGPAAAGRHHPVLAQLAGEGTDPGPRPGTADPTVGSNDQGPHLYADRRDRRRVDHLAAGDARRGAQLGLPLHVDPRLDVHAPGAALSQSRLGGRRVHAVHRRPPVQRRWRAADHVRDRRATGSDGDAPRGTVGLRRRPPGTDWQRRLQPAPERRLRRRAGLGAAPHEAQPTAATTAVAARAVAGRVRHSGVASTRPGHLEARGSRSSTSPRS